MDRLHRPADVRATPRRSPTALLELVPHRATEDGGADEIHIVYTHFVNMGRQEVRGPPDPAARGRRARPPTEAAAAGQGPFPLYDFEPVAEAVLDALLPRYVENLVYTALLSRRPPSTPPVGAP